MTICSSSTRDLWKFVMHPIKAALVGKSLYAVNDPNGNKLGELLPAPSVGRRRAVLLSMCGKNKDVGVVGAVSTWGVVIGTAIVTGCI